MKVLMACDIYTDGKKNIASQFVRAQAVALKSMNIDVAILSLDLRSFRRKRRLGIYKYELDGIPVFVAGIPCGPIPGVLELFSKISARILFKKVLREFGKPDLLHVHFYQNAIYIKGIKQKYNIPMLLTEHSSSLLEVNRIKQNEKKALECYNHCDKVICVGNNLKNDIATFYKGNIDVIPNILLDIFFYEPNKDKEFTFIAVGRLTELKNFNLIIEAFSRFNNQIKNSKLIIVGEGDLEDVLKEQVKNLGIEKAINFIGHVINSEMPILYNQSHCFVLPSQYETFGVVYIEALACGLPIISSLYARDNLIVNEKNGIAIPENTVDEVTQAMFLIYKNIDNYNAKEISKDTIEKYGEEKITQLILSSYKGVINEK